MAARKKTEPKEPKATKEAKVEPVVEDVVVTEVVEEKKPAALKEPESGFWFAHGRRKTATARARLYLPTKDIVIDGKKLEKGDIYVNNKPIDAYFSGPYAKEQYTEVYRTTNTIGRFITTVITSGSGSTGQLGATTLAIARALVTVDPKFRATLRKKGFMTRDPRAKERKKPGLMGARKQKSSPKR